MVYLEFVSLKKEKGKNKQKIGLLFCIFEGLHEAMDNKLLAQIEGKYVAKRMTKEWLCWLYFKRPICQTAFEALEQFTRQEGYAL